MLTALIYLNKQGVNVFKIEFWEREGKLKFTFKFYYNDSQLNEYAAFISVYNNKVME